MVNFSLKIYDRKKIPPKKDQRVKKGTALYIVSREGKTIQIKIKISSRINLFYSNGSQANRLLFLSLHGGCVGPKMNSSLSWRLESQCSSLPLSASSAQHRNQIRLYVIFLCSLHLNVFFYIISTGAVACFSFFFVFSCV